MKKACSIFAVTLVFLLWGYRDASATKWVELNPKKVIERADVIVVGTYDISANAEHDSVYAGYPFKTSKVYKGEVMNPMVVGIDQYDLGIVEEFQENGGEYLLFLEDGEADFLVPVGGPNGMIELENGEVRVRDGVDSELYKEVLSKKSDKPVDLADEDNDTAGDDGSGHWWLYLSGIAVIGVLFFGRFKKG
ncbi:hypothetical protein ACFFJY_17900 [Fictibacillus aquaticus]|uniref:Gram-positive cocci surface proteins LPxTG domain-containing protein n=1 Tax=Fictibacillus aquaticus TaxID=2021314 RepID=A0A235F643_9BACL|nr:hypothetical protein [Fictibacillus aquaticus]OYD56583.1 hypothetical protein CGZ90_16355 [Fictibacillus aquaticus]